MRSAVIGFVLGVGWLQMQAALPDLTILLMLVTVLVLLGLLIRHAAFFSRILSAKIAGLALCGAFAGFVWAALFAHHYLDNELPKEWEGKDVTIVGTVDSLPYRFDQGVRFNFAVERVLADHGEMPAIPPKISLAWYAAFRGEDIQTVGDVQPGERWQLTVRLQRPHGNANPWGFDYEVWLLEQNLRATGYVRPDANSSFKNQRQDRFVVSIGNAVERCRGWLRDRIVAALPDKKYAGVIVALVVGDQRAVSQSDWQVFNRTGIGHLISISGLHITMIAGLFAGLIFQLWRRSFFTNANLPLLLPAQKAAALAGVLAALVYVLLAGFGVPAQRTLYMLTVIAVALWFDRMTSVSHVLCVALGVVVLIDPWAVLGPGFWLSFGAVAMMLYASVGRVVVFREETPTNKERWWATLKSGAHMQYVVTIGLVPLTMLLFGQVSLVSPIANALAIPVVSLIVTPLALLGSVLPSPLSGWILSCAHQIIAWLAIVMEWLAALPKATWTAPIPSWWIFACAGIGTVWLLAPRGWPMRWAGWLAWIPLLLNAPVQPKQQEVWVTAFDVGQGMALLIETPQHRLLYDTGPYYSPESDGGSRVILPYLKARGINQLDGVIVTHSDNDHSGGALSIFDGMQVKSVWSSLPQTHPIVQAAPNHRRCEAGQSWTWDGVQFEMLHPTPASYDSTKWKPNARGCTLKITNGSQSMLLAADIEAVQEDELVNSIPDKLRATVLLAPHHGSGTSSTEPFLLAVKPELAVFQVGYRNRYRHPKPEVFERYGMLGIKRLRSDESGSITLQFGATMQFNEYRKDHARYWYGK
jgi:competence protein ComEC